MRVVTAVICEEINRSDSEGRVHLFSVRDTFDVARLPARVTFQVYIGFVAPPGLSEFTIGTGCLPRVPIDRWDIKQASVVVPTDDRGAGESRFTFDLRVDFTARHAGWHDLVILEGDREALATVPFRVLVAEV